MSTTIIDLLQNASKNLCLRVTKLTLKQMEGRDQLTNAIELLEKGYPADTDVDQLIAEADGNINDVPDYEG